MSGNFSERLASLLSDKIKESENSNTLPIDDFDDLQTESVQDDEKNIQFAKEEAGKEREKLAANFQKMFATQNKVGQIVRAYNYIESVPQEIEAAFAVLGCPRDSTQKQVQAAFRKKIKVAHPDVQDLPARKNIFSGIIMEETEKNQEAERLIRAYEKITEWFGQKNSGTA